jgi:CubicO group peptidase (beta-lactamase class C family)
MTPRTSLSFDSVTKVATAALALRLVEQGRLRLDDPIRRWYPAWQGDAAATVRDLLGHTSGLGDPSDRFFRGMVRRPRRAVTPAQALAATPRPGRRTTKPSTRTRRFILAGVILRRAAGAPVATAMRRELFRTPGGGGLAMQPAERPCQPLAHVYSPNGGGAPTDLATDGPYIPSLAWASGATTAGALAGDVPSLARWGHALLGGHILTRSSLREMTRFRRDAFWTSYGPRPGTELDRRTPDVGSRRRWPRHAHRVLAPAETEPHHRRHLERRRTQPKRAIPRDTAADRARLTMNSAAAVVVPAG